jgi:hypothetical protein
MVNFYAQHRRKAFSGGGGGAGFEPETTTLLASLGGTYSGGQQNAINALIAGLKTDGLWTKLDQFWWCLQTSADSLVNWKIPGTFNLTNSGSTFTTNTEFKFNSSGNHLSSNFVPSTAGGNYSLNSATVGVWAQTASTNFGYLFGASAGGNNLVAAIFDTLYTRLGLNSNSFNDDGTNPSATGLIILTRTGSSSVSISRNTSTRSTSSIGSTGLPTFAIAYGGENNSGSVGQRTNAGLAGGFIGGGFTTTDRDNMHSRLTTFRSAYP